MTSTLGGNDPLHDFPEDDKDREERRLRKEARDRYAKQPKERRKLLNRANEISCEKSKRAHQE